MNRNSHHKQSIWKIVLFPEPERSSKKGLLNRYKLTTCQRYQIGISGTDAQPRRLHFPSISIFEMP